MNYEYGKHDLGWWNHNLTEEENQAWKRAKQAILQQDHEPLPQVIPLSTEGVAELLGRQGDPGDETTYTTPAFIWNGVEWVDPRSPAAQGCGGHVADFDGLLDDLFPEKSGISEANPPKDIKSEIANEALSIVNGARRSAYGKPERNFDRIAEFWNSYLRIRFPHVFYAVELEPRDIPAMMRLMKEARLIETRDHKDSFTDIIGYALCQAEMEVK